jgi:hypothetical protein
MMNFSVGKNLLVVLIMSVVLTSGMFFIVKDTKFIFADQTASLVKPEIPPIVVAPTAPLPPPPPQKLANPPKVINAVYVTAYSAGTKKYLDYLTELFKKTEINAVVVDIKGSNGYVSFNSEVEDVKKYNLGNNAITDIDSLIRFFHDQNIYVIGRVAVFEDPEYSKARPEFAIYNKVKTIDIKNPVLWKDNNGLSWLDPSSKDVWDYDLALAKNGLYHGFDEINFDYVRFPSDGKVSNMGFPVSDPAATNQSVIKEFFQYLRKNLQGERISADLFGQTTVNKDDMGIGQIIENAFENFDYVSPMVYPSHYINGFIGYPNPAEYPYQVVKYCMSKAENRENIFMTSLQPKPSTEVTETPAEEESKTEQAPVVIPLSKFRPWLQDFNMGASYTAEMVKQEIKATKDSLGEDYSGYMLWNASNIYTEGAITK